MCVCLSEWKDRYCLSVCVRARVCEYEQREECCGVSVYVNKGWMVCVHGGVSVGVSGYGKLAPAEPRFGDRSRTRREMSEWGHPSPRVWQDWLMGLGAQVVWWGEDRTQVGGVLPRGATLHAHLQRRSAEGGVLPGFRDLSQSSQLH